MPAAVLLFIMRNHVDGVAMKTKRELIENSKFFRQTEEDFVETVPADA